MAKSRVKTEITLELTTQEALYLKSLLQSYLGSDEDREPPLDRETRVALFNALPSFTRLQDA